MRDLPPPSEVFVAKARSVEQRLRRLEQGSVLRGRPSVNEIRIGDVVLTIDESASPILSLVMTNLRDGLSVTIATI